MDAVVKAVRLVLGVDERTVTILKFQNTPPYLGMSRASFRQLDAHPNKGKKDKTDAEEGATQDGEYAPVHTD